MTDSTFLSFTESLHHLLAVPYPLVQVVTFEEGRAVGVVRQLAGAMERSLQMLRPEDHADPRAALLAILQPKTPHPDASIFVCIDMHHYLNDSTILRALRVWAAGAQGRNTTVVFVDPVAWSHSELARDWTQLHMPLPDATDLRDVLASVLEDTRPAGVPASAWDEALPHDRLCQAALGLTMREAERAFRKAAAIAGLQHPRRHNWEDDIIGEKRRLIRGAGALEFHPHRGTLADVGGLDELKNWLRERERAFRPEARAFGLPPPRGLLLLGVQGCGKSLAAKAIAGHWGLPLLRLDIAALYASDQSTDEGLRRALATATTLAPCVLWIDELEKALESDGDADAARILGTLLTWLQERTAPVFFVATANRVDRLPPELLRRGRVDEIFFVDLPDAAARAEILGIHLRQHGRDPARFDLPAIAAASENHAGAELEQVVLAGMHAAFARGNDVQTHDLLVAARLLVPLYALYETEIKALRTWANGRARPAGRDRRLVDLFANTPRSGPTP